MTVKFYPDAAPDPKTLHTLEDVAEWTEVTQQRYQVALDAEDWWLAAGPYKFWQEWHDRRKNELDKLNERDCYIRAKNAQDAGLSTVARIKADRSNS